MQAQAGKMPGASRGIYDDLRREIDLISQVLEQPASDPDLSAGIETARESFQKLKSETDSTLEQLDRNVEWDNFVVAFYGETNAGKSTIIETLRIMMGEESKVEQQNNFRAKCAEYGVDDTTPHVLERKNQEATALAEELAQLEHHFEESKRGQLVLEEEASAQVEELSRSISSLPLWRRALSFIWQIPERQVLESKKKALDCIRAETELTLQQHEQQKQSLLVMQADAQEISSRLAAALRELALLEDGSIIGDGRSDFTRETTRYNLDVGGNKLTLLDVPGIEGKEELVLEPIMQAVQKAHAVFYVTRKADPPQKGDEVKGTKGTLEKIKGHLGAQTEVWTIFNKGIKSVEPLRAKELINGGEREGLAVLNVEMRTQLGDHYAGIVPLSAYAAFLASTDHLTPGGEKNRARGKFLAAMDTESIQRKAGMLGFVEMLSSEMSENARDKIRRSNYNKANEAVLRLRDCVTLLNKKTFAPLEKKLQRASQDGARQLDSAMKTLKRKLEAEAAGLMDAVKRGARKEIYADIERDISNDELKSALEARIERCGDELNSELRKMADKNFKEFERKVAAILEQFKEHVDGFLSDACKPLALDMDIKVKINTGISVAGLIGGVAGVVFGIANAWNPAGWIVIAFGVLSIAGSLITLGKSVWSYFDSDYKQRQQKDSVTKNLEEIFASCQENFGRQLGDGFEQFKDRVKEIKKGLDLPSAQAAQVVASLSDAKKRLTQISQRVVKDGGL